MIFLIVFILICVVLAFLSYRLTDWLSPSFVMCMVFIASALTVAPVFNSWNLSFSATSVVVLSIGLTSAVCADAVVSSRYKKTVSSSANCVSRCEYSLKIPPIFFWPLVLFCGVVLLAYYRELVRVSGGNIAAYHSLVINAASSEDAGLSTLTNQGIKILTVLAYVSLYVFIHNVLLAKQQVRQNVLYLTVPIMHCIRVFYSGGRLGWICFAVYAAVLVLCMYRSKRNWGRTEFRLILRTILVALLFLVLFYVSTNWIRVFGTSKSIFEYIAIYFGIPMISFDMFLNDPVVHSLSYFGQETFSRLYNGFGKLGFDFSYVSTALEYRYAGPNANGNVYTFFRRPYSDFGIIGMIIVTVTVVVILSFLYHKAIYRKHIDGMNVYLLFYAYLFNVVALASVDNELVQLIQIGNLVTWIALYLFAKYLVVLIPLSAEEGSGALKGASNTSRPDFSNQTGVFNQRLWIAGDGKYRIGYARVGQDEIGLSSDSRCR